MGHDQILKIIRQIILAFCLVFLISACNVLPGGITPEDAVRRNFSSPDFQVAIVRNLNDGAVVLFHKTRPDQVPGSPGGLSYQLGFSYLDRQNGRWMKRSGRSGSYSVGQGEKAIFQITRVQTQGPKPGMEEADDSALPLIVFGKILDAHISRIELVKDDGQTIGDTPSASMFAFLEIPPSLPCTLRFEDSQGKAIEEYSLAGLPEWQVASALSQKIKDACPNMP